MFHVLEFMRATVTKLFSIYYLARTKLKAKNKHQKNFIKSMRGHIHVLRQNINTKYIYMYKLWPRQIEAYQVPLESVNSQIRKTNLPISAPNALFLRDIRIKHNYYELGSILFLKDL